MKRAAAPAVAALAVLCAIFLVRPHATAGPPMRDFEAYYAAGSTWVRGHDPYGLGIWQAEKHLAGVNAQRYEVLPFVSPPAILPIFAALSLLPFLIANALWRGLLVACLAGLAWLVARLANLRPRPLCLLALAVAVVGFGPVTSALALGQLALPVALAIAYAFWARTMFGTGVAAAIACVQPNLAVALAGRLRDSKAATAIVAGVILFAIVAVAVARPGIAQYFRVLTAHGSAERFSAIQLTPAAIAYGFGASEPVAGDIGIILAVIAVALWLWGIIAIADRFTLFCLSCALLPFVSPFVHEHDLALLFVPAVLLVVRVSRALLPRAIAATLLCATDWLGLAQRPDGWLQTLLLVGALAVALLSLRGEMDWRAWDAPAAILLLIAAAGFVARTHALPVWPDGMVPVAAHGSTIASVWQSEQRATGLFERNSFWALLRCASLAGCASLAITAILSSRSPAHSKTSAPAPA